MYVVFFEAELNETDQEYLDTAAQLRELAMEYGCVDFESACIDGFELSISYWESREQIERWKQNEQHLAAQEKGRERWYKSWKVTVA